MRWIALLVVSLICCKNAPTPIAITSNHAEGATVPDSVDVLEHPSWHKLPEGWVDLGLADSTLDLDIRYATDDNFVSQAMYPCGRCILRSKPAEKILLLQSELKSQGLGLKLFDCYRPSSVQQLLWKKVPDARYVTPPSKGSMHNRGVAVDLTLVELDSEEELDMGTIYDFFGEQAYHTYTQHSTAILQNRALLKNKMAEIGFKHIRTEWWHYSFTQGSFEISDYKWDCPEL